MITPTDSSFHFAPLRFRHSIVNNSIHQAYNIHLAETEKRESYSLIKAAQYVETKEMWVITLDTDKQVKVNGFTIQFIPVWKWLLAY